MPLTWSLQKPPGIGGGEGRCVAWPSARFGHCLIPAVDGVYMIGGWDGASLLGDVWVLRHPSLTNTTSTYSWELLHAGLQATSGPNSTSASAVLATFGKGADSAIMTPRFKHVACMFSTHIWVWGGQTTNPRAENQAHCFDLVSKRWIRAVVLRSLLGVTLESRTDCCLVNVPIDASAGSENGFASNFAASTSSEIALVWGGTLSSHFASVLAVSFQKAMYDVFVQCPSSLAQEAEAAPQGSCSMVAVGGLVVFLVGSIMQSKVYVLDIGTKAWSVLACSVNGLNLRINRVHYGVTPLVPDAIYVLGGCAVSNPQPGLFFTSPTPSNECFMLKLNQENMLRIPEEGEGDGDGDGDDEGGTVAPSTSRSRTSSNPVTGAVWSTVDPDPLWYPVPPIYNCRACTISFPSRLLFIGGRTGVTGKVTDHFIVYRTNMKWERIRMRFRVLARFIGASRLARKRMRPIQMDKVHQTDVKSAATAAAAAAAPMKRAERRAADAADEANLARLRVTDGRAGTFLYGFEKIRAKHAPPTRDDPKELDLGEKGTLSTSTAGSSHLGSSKSQPSLFLQRQSSMAAVLRAPLPVPEKTAKGYEKPTLSRLSTVSSIQVPSPQPAAFGNRLPSLSPPGGSQSSVSPASSILSSGPNSVSSDGQYFSPTNSVSPASAAVSTPGSGTTPILLKQGSKPHLHKQTSAKKLDPLYSQISESIRNITNYQVRVASQEMGQVIQSKEQISQRNAMLSSGRSTPIDQLFGVDDDGATAPVPSLQRGKSQGYGIGARIPTGSSRSANSSPTRMMRRY
eukprot:ANDGO_01703.mRNA.1 hypothetical protein